MRTNGRGSSILRVFVLAVLAGGGQVFATGVTPNKVLFDATKAEMAGNADWVVDADSHNVGNQGGLMVVGAGSESNPQRFPTPAQSGITASTAETYWTGALSAWGVALAKRGFQIETLPIGGRITFGDSTNAQDLSNYGIYVVDEPNIAFTAAEKAAIIAFVNAGGGLFMISDHTGSDRNSDGIDAVGVWNALPGSTFGITFNSDDVSPDSFAVDTNTADPIIRGAAGNVTEMKYSDGATITISTAQNASVKAAIWSSSSHTNSNVLVAYATYGQGKVVACGDSSPFEDGTGDPNDTLYNGWTADASGNHAVLTINACLWLNPSAPACTPATVSDSSPASVTVRIGKPITLTGAGAGTAPVAYRWRFNTANLSDGGDYSGTATTSLTITPSTRADAGSYDITSSNACGNATSAVATNLTVLCPADFNSDGQVTVQDIFDFLGAWFAASPSADFNGAGGVTVQDIFDFLTAWFAACPS